MTVQRRGWWGVLLLVATVVFWAPQGGADMTVRGPEGRLILLQDDGTWRYLEDEDDTPAEHVRLKVERVRSGTNSCVIGLRLFNNLNAPVRSLVPEFSAYKDGQVKIETVFQSFSRIKPTQDQYQEIRFTGITCDEIGYVLVHGADRCSMGDLSKFSYNKGECLDRIVVQPTDLIRITK